MYLFVMLYIFWFLHQTTTLEALRGTRERCISFDSYIKPQLCLYSLTFYWVVYLLIPTSNHNWIETLFEEQLVVYLLIPTSNHNLHNHLYLFVCVVYLLIPTSNHNQFLITHLNGMLYIFWFLHQTTTVKLITVFADCCISFDSYIKPQP